MKSMLGVNLSSTGSDDALFQVVTGKKVQRTRRYNLGIVKVAITTPEIEWDHDNARPVEMAQEDPGAEVHRYLRKPEPQETTTPEEVN